jgi:hypothetical protein
VRGESERRERERERERERVRERERERERRITGGEVDTVGRMRESKSFCGSPLHRVK